tara:strand:+ start:11947 stop:12363 length:417 start_codon:yes stop_codon:yes gene_type:complete
MDRDKEVEELNRQWFIDALLKIKSMHRHTQEAIAENLGVTQPMISRIKGGTVKVPRGLIDKVVEFYKLDSPEAYQADFTKEYSSVKEEEASYLSTIKIRYKMLESNFMDIKRELETTYSFIATLEEFNAYLKTDLNHK